MNPKLLLRIAAVIIFLHAFGHTTGIYTWKQPDSHVPQELVKQMTEQKFEFMGKQSTIAGLYDGLGYASTIALLLVVFLLWIVSSAKENHAPFSVKILMTVFLFLIFLGVLELVYFFPMAVAFSFIGALLTLIAIFKLSKTANS